ncbi:MAG: hypothetical protein ACYDBV_08020 [Nitrospiria bacterium]
MICPYLMISGSSKIECKCTATREILKLHTETVNEYCATDEYYHCISFQENDYRLKKRAILDKKVKTAVPL